MGLKVLLVEDDLDMRDALDLLSGEWRPQIIVLDIIMPVMDGFTFLQHKQVAAEITPIPVVVVSATAEPPIEGARCVLRKPVEWSDLAQAIALHATA